MSVAGDIKKISGDANSAGEGAGTAVPPSGGAGFFRLSAPEALPRPVYSFLYRVFSGVVLAVVTGIIGWVLQIVSGAPLYPYIVAFQACILAAYLLFLEGMLMSIYQRYVDKKQDDAVHKIVKQLIDVSLQAGQTSTRKTGLLLRTNRLIKVFLDAVLAWVALFLVAPLFALIATLIRLESPGPVFYKQARIGKDGKQFGALYFRTAYVDASLRAKSAVEERRELRKECGDHYKQQADPRITLVGRFLRRYSFNRLPMLINILIGDMSFIGPQPYSQHEHHVELSEQLGIASILLQVRPGLIGASRLSENELTREACARVDASYVLNWSLWIDAKILWRAMVTNIRS
jgi:lipopolysaccharide/colanic/teichoic acid biosynthesis glycosyltransferase